MPDAGHYLFVFNQIIYGGPDLPDEGEVLEFRREDGEEIVAGDVLLVVRASRS